MERISAALLQKCFYLGVSYGQLLMEEERENEDIRRGCLLRILVKEQCSVCSCAAAANTWSAKQ